MPALALLAFALVMFTLGLSEGSKVRTCPSHLEDGRQLVSMNKNSGQCLYSPPMHQYSPTELRRLAGARERQERIGK